MSDLISREAALDAVETEMKYGAVIDQCGLETAYDIIENLSSAEPEERAYKWHINFDPYDESTSPKEAGHYRIIEEDGTERTDYFFGEPRMTSHGIGYWATSEKVIVAWARLEWK